MRAIKAAVILMGVVIVAGTIAMIVALVQRGTNTNPDDNAAALPALSLPAGARVVQVTAAGKDLILLVDVGGGQRIVILDRRSGAVRRRLQIETAP